MKKTFAILMAIAGNASAPSLASAVADRDFDCVARLHSIATERLISKLNPSAEALDIVRFRGYVVSIDAQRRIAFALHGSEVVASVAGESDLFRGTITTALPSLLNVSGRAPLCLELKGETLQPDLTMNACAKQRALLARAPARTAEGATARARWGDALDASLEVQEHVLRLGGAIGGATLDPRLPSIAAQLERRPEPAADYFGRIERFAAQARACFESSNEDFGRARWRDVAIRMEAQLRGAR